jgi:hypothetical protein
VSYLAEAGHVYEVVRPHFVFTIGGDLVDLDNGELLLVVVGEAFQGNALRLETGELVHMLLLEIGGLEGQTYTRVWPE